MYVFIYLFITQPATNSLLLSAGCVLILFCNKDFEIKLL